MFDLNVRANYFNRLFDYMHKNKNIKIVVWVRGWEAGSKLLIEEYRLLIQVYNEGFIFLNIVADMRIQLKQPHSSSY